MGVIKFVVWFFLVMIMAAFVLLALQLFGFFVPMECLSAQTREISGLIQEAIKIPVGKEKIKKLEVRDCIENVTKKEKIVCIYGEKDYRCLESEVNVVFLNKKGEPVDHVKEGIYLVTISSYSARLQEI